MMGEPPEYPGVEFHPPAGTVASEQMEGDALVKWKKIGDRYTIVMFEGKKITPPDAEMSSDEVEKIKETKTREGSMKELDAIAFLA